MVGEPLTVDRGPMHRRVPVVVFAALVGAALATPSPATAQTCWRGRPLPDCTSFAITEVGFSFGSRRDSANAGGAATGHLMTWELGYMRNLGERYAVGGTAFVEGDGLGMARLRAGLKGRYRVWLEGNRSVDVAPGVILLAEEPSTPSNPDGSLTAGYDLGGLLAVSYNLGDLVSLTAQVEALQRPAKELQMSGYVGVRFGSYPGAVAALVALVAVVLSIPSHSTAF